MDNMRNWLALFVAITHYSDLTVDESLERAYGFYRFSLVKEVVTPDKIRHIVKCLSRRPNLKTLQLLENRCKINKRTIIAIYHLSKRV